MSEKYPRHVKVDFMKLRASTLRRYLWYYNIQTPARGTGSQAEMAAACARHFGTTLQVDEVSTLTNFAAWTQLHGCGSSTSGTGGDDGTVENLTKKRKRFSSTLPAGSKVAARVSGEWILTNVIKYSKRRKQYKVEDADEMTENPPAYDVHEDWVLPLPNENDPEAPRLRFNKGERVLALYPGTSSFYPASVSKRQEKGGKGTYEYSLQFDDDEQDANGNIRVKKVASAWVINSE